MLSGVEPLNKGDTLDALPLPGGKVALMVADVVGSGFGATVAVSQVKAILRERLSAGAGLAGALSSADQYAHDHAEVCATTVCIALLGLRDGTLEWATAGHPPPFLLTPGAEPRLLSSEPSRPLGTGGHVVSHRARLEVGEMLGLYTDGLVCADGEGLDVGYDRLFQAFSEAVASPAGAVIPAQRGDELCDRVLRSALLPEGNGDDAVLLLATRVLEPDPFRLNVAAVPENLPMIRHRINQWLDGLGVGLLDHVGLGHAVVELAANAVAHAYVSLPEADPVVEIEGELGDDGTVRVTVCDRGRWRERESRGRGLMMASGLVDSIRVVRSRRGTRVTLTQRLTRPVPLLQQVVDGTGALLDESQELVTRTEPGRLVATGAVDDLSVEVFHAALNEATRAGTADAVVDLTGVTHLASPGVQTLFEFVGRTRRTGATLSLRAPVESPAGQILQLVDLPISG
ncbi:SpoIIE family protein phosphatase [Nocardioides alcanivorans]|uniref:SpoIIE family protein phosphatase n=1 Tax=Nocardioides alcanivorans TaxID=2897352 RepID=UPI001F4502E8|nr:SpoIIE family protein phosphatase [Nocardioides alcanivorans]